MGVGSLFFQPVYDSANAILNERLVEVDEQPQFSFGQPKVGEPLPKMDGRKCLNGLQLNDDEDLPELCAPTGGEPLR